VPELVSLTWILQKLELYSFLPKHIKLISLTTFTGEKDCRLLIGGVRVKEKHFYTPRYGTHAKSMQMGV